MNPFETESSNDYRRELIFAKSPRVLIGVPLELIELLAPTGIMQYCIFQH